MTLPSPPRFNLPPQRATTKQQRTYLLSSRRSSGRSRTASLPLRNGHQDRSHSPRLPLRGSLKVFRLMRVYQSRNSFHCGRVPSETLGLVSQTFSIGTHCQVTKAASALDKVTFTIGGVPHIKLCSNVDVWSSPHQQGKRGTSVLPVVSERATLRSVGTTAKALQ